MTMFTIHTQNKCVELLITFNDIEKKFTISMLFFRSIKNNEKCAN